MRRSTIGAVAVGVIIAGGGVTANASTAATPPPAVNAAAIPGVTIGIPDGVRAPVRHHNPALPGWVHWRYAPGYWRDNGDCGALNGKRPIVVWAGHGDTSVLICPNGLVWPS